MDESGIAWKSDTERFEQVSGFKYEVASAGQPVTDANCVTQLGAGSKVYPYSGVGSTVYCFFYPDDTTVQYLYETYPNQISPIDGVTDEHFIVWMRTAGLPTFRKLYGKISEDYKSGDSITFMVTANFEVSSYDASKGLVISTLGPMGGKNPFIGVAYVVVGSISLFLALLFGIKYFLDPRKQGNALLHWD